MNGMALMMAASAGGTALAVIGIIVALSLFILIANIRIVPQAHAYVIEWLGSYKTTWDTGLHLKVPFFEKVGKRVVKMEQVVDFPPQAVITKDNAVETIPTYTVLANVTPRLPTLKACA